MNQRILIPAAIIIMGYFAAKFITGSTSSTLSVAVVILSLIFVGLLSAPRKISRNLYRYVLILIPFTHIGIVYSDFVSTAYVLIAGFILYVVVRRVGDRGFSGLWGYEFVLVLFIIYLGLTLLRAVEWRETIKQYLGILVAAGLVLALHQGGLGPSQAATAKRDIVIVGAVLGLLGILQIMFGERFYPTYYMNISDVPLSPSDRDIFMLETVGFRTARAIGTFLNANAYGLFLITPFCICVDEFIKSKKLTYLPFLILIIGGVVSTFSRGVYILTILGMILLSGFYLRRGRVLAVIFIILLALMAGGFVSQKYASTMTNIFTGDSDSSLRSNIRYQFWEIAMKSFWTSPVFGQGYGNVGYNPNTNIVGFDPHSSYLNILVNQGGVGLGLFILWLITSYVTFKRVLQYDKITLQPLFVVFLVYLISLMIDGFFLSEPFVYFMPMAFLAIYTGGLRSKVFSYPTNRRS